jgi:hypothetical protein
MTKTVDVGAELCRRLKDFTTRLEAGEPLMDRQSDRSLQLDILDHLQSLPTRGKTACLLREALTALDVATAIIADVPEWTAVKERLPSPGRYWTYCDKNGESIDAVWTGKYWASSDLPFETPTHWMPLPEPPSP